MMRRPQFTLKAMLWLMAVVASFFAGAAWQAKKEEARRQEFWNQWLIKAMVGDGPQQNN